MPPSNALKKLGSVYCIATGPIQLTPGFLTTHDSIPRLGRGTRREYLHQQRRKAYY